MLKKKCKLGRYRFGYMSILVILSTVTMIYQMNKFELVTSLISQLNYKTELQDIQRKEFSSHALNPVKTAGRQLKNKPNIFNANLTLSQWDSRHLFKFLDSVLSDIIPSTGMADNLQEFLRQSRCEKLCAYVIPVYEIDKNVSFPQNKYQITNFAKEGLARPFHQMIYVNGHYSTNYKMWEDNTRDVQDAVHVNHNVTKCAGWYEPFYVAHAATPDFDERFIGYGFTRNTQVYEMIAAGYQFQVLSPIFSCHWGLQNITEVYNPWRKKQVFMNSRLITTFKSEIDARHRNVAQFPALPLHADSRQTRSDWRTQIPATQTLELGRIP
ncbi:beta-1,4-glucuronyltransferase 1-like isoform X7 [Zootermopsis nevadensis]|uniref:beta-1,4-glucuronyltransferase 1-like isoform X7 n=1 Tax=Zootermopsis nevadensis TaxID=136037 RepID=UPI000B8E7C9F|nr:beta-1,4-glucuronyltransferase 1-like isoform X7 [Zootermopsis nevadensis]